MWVAKFASPECTRSKAKNNVNTKTIDQSKVLNQKLNHESVPIVKTSNSTQTDMTYSGLMNIDTDLIKRLDFFTQQNEELVESTNTLQHCSEKKCQNYKANIAKIGKECETVKLELNSKNTLSSWGSIINRNNPLIKKWSPG